MENGSIEITIRDDKVVEVKAVGVGGDLMEHESAAVVAKFLHEAYTAMAADNIPDTFRKAFN